MKFNKLFLTSVLVCSSLQVYGMKPREVKTAINNAKTMEDLKKVANHIPNKSIEMLYQQKAEELQPAGGQGGGAKAAGGAQKTPEQQKAMDIFSRSLNQHKAKKAAKEVAKNQTTPGMDWSQRLAEIERAISDAVQNMMQAQNEHELKAHKAAADTKIKALKSYGEHAKHAVHKQKVEDAHAQKMAALKQPAPQKQQKTTAHKQQKTTAHKQQKTTAHKQQKPAAHAHAQKHAGDPALSPEEINLIREVASNMQAADQANNNVMPEFMNHLQAKRHGAGGPNKYRKLGRLGKYKRRLGRV